MCDINKTKFFYFLMCLAGFLIILLPVGIANLIFGYVLADSPCTSCWGQRESMVFIGVAALFIVRYGVKGKFLAFLLIATAFGLWQSFNHIAGHAHRDLDQGFGLPIFGLHTYFWAEVVFWAVVLLLGVIFAFAPKFGSFEKEMEGSSFRQLTKFNLIAMSITALIIASNVFQAFVSTGIPPYSGQGDPVRFSLNPKYIIWDDSGWNKRWNGISFLGKRDVKEPDFAFAPASDKLGIKFDNNISNSPFTHIDENLKIINEMKIDIAKPLNTLDYINGEYVASSKYDVYFLDNSFKIKEDFILDPYFSATINPIVGIIPYLDDKYILMGSNKTFLRFGKNPNADDALQYADFMKGSDKFEGQGKDLGRGRIDTIRAKFNHIASTATDNDFMYVATTPNNKDMKTFVISKISLADRVLSAEFTPKAKLKENKTLGDLYITSMTYKDGKLYALSKNHNVIAVIDLDKEEIVKTISFPENITNARSLFFKNGKINILSYQDNANILYALD
ncbi:disulfide bond formation protein B [Campylobacter insulaenigrae]|uniref:DsbB-related disulfide oxidoreductase n=1 Tax=Campylobacter insulaenigrae NCTC 12927 TaxID=1031564 RepID=A0A0A8H409_9BACT|nr:disulfide bond formation protein B [Campylobacter insulaenigrae]AJC88395.1 DsbB-related disulfide oxidoreductase [Campylobacter insulaenigrae NCTC 12927]MCR6591493.1 disulfide bond formation protein B [Campylobacter insulaenigrae]MCR6593028.1 disulfide bond formation protein B [Campylobacter insulaenigrae]VEH96026.1 disulfide bond formation protein, DsbB family [Campylobacter insulaenigrae]VEJ52297.1 disulfide bond formation protein, DsbB family [Campylobacter insulaenigrae]